MLGRLIKVRDMILRVRERKAEFCTAEAES